MTTRNASILVFFFALVLSGAGVSFALEIQVVSPEDYQVGILQLPPENTTCYIDRLHVFEDAPPYYVGLPFLRTAIRDRAEVSEDFMTFTVDEPVRLYVCYANRGVSSFPNWLLENFTDTGELISRTYATLNVWESDALYPPGSITLGGNRSDGTVVVDSHTMYLVLVEPVPPFCGDGIADQSEECGEPGLACEPGYVCDEENCVCIPKVLDQGCSPGYWKQDQHFDTWVGYTPGYPGDVPTPSLFSDEDAFDTVITIRWKAKTGEPQDLTNPTLLQALQAKGGGINELARHGAAALLNVANPDVAYSLSLEEVLSAFEDGDAGTLVGANESLCPPLGYERLPREGETGPDVGTPGVGGCGTTASSAGFVGPKGVNLSMILLAFGAIILLKRLRRQS